MDFNVLEHKIDQGDHEVVKKQLEQLNLQDIDEPTLIRINLLLSRIMREYGNAKASLALSKPLIEKSKAIDNYILQIQATIETAYAYWYLGRYDNGIQLCKDSIQLIKSQKKDLVIDLEARNFLLLGNLYGDKDRPEDALKYYTDSLKLFQKSKNTIGTGYAYNNIGEVYRLQGKLDESLACFARSKEHFEQVGNLLDVAMSLSNIAEIYREKGDLKPALDFAYQAKNIQTTLEHNYLVAFTDVTIGLIHHSQGNLPKAIYHYKMSVDTLTQQDNIVWTSQALYYYILALVEIDFEESQNQLQMMQTLIDENHEKIKVVELQYNALQAVILKKSNTLSNFVQAQEVFSEIVKSKDIIDYSITLLAMKHLAELLLIELKLFNNPDTLREFIDLIQALKNTAELHGSILLQIQVLILYAKLKALDGDFHTTNEALDVANQLASKRELTQIMTEIVEVRSDIYDEIKRYSESELNFKDMQDRLTQLDIEGYLNEILMTGILSAKKQS